MSSKDIIQKEMLFQLKNNLLDKWYPKVIDKEDGGYLTNLNFDFSLAETQEKMIVTQARHVWTLSKATEFFDIQEYKISSQHGINFLKNKMWDKINGGFYQIKSKEGNYSDVEGWRNEKRVYGNAYGLYGLAALYKLSNQKEVLEFAKKVFHWIENYAHDSVNKGYYQFFTEDNIVINQDSKYKSIATDSIEIGYKDQNSSIHLLEAFTEFYNVYKNSLLRERLKEMLVLIRDKITTEKGYLQLFFNENWETVSFREDTSELRENNYRLDHVSFGHDYETAFLMLEASHALGIEDDLKTLRVAKKMVDHALANGWDRNNGGFFDEGYYFLDDDYCSIIEDSKTWWAQAEALNIFLIMAKIFPNEKKYMEIFIHEWEYVKSNIIDNENGGWYWGGLDKDPVKKLEPKGTIWKGTYHTGRALMNCIVMLADDNHLLFKSSKGFRELFHKSNEFISHWRKIGESFQ